MTLPHRPARARLVLAAKLFVTFGLLALAIWTNRSQLRDVLGHRPDGRLVGLAFAAYLAGVLLAYLRWFLLVRAAGLAFRPRDAFRLGAIGTLFNFVIPGAIGGDFVKAAYLCREQAKSARPIATVVIDRIVGLMGLFLLAGLAGTIGWSRLDPPVRRLVTAAWIAVGVTIAVLVLAFALPALRRNRPGGSRRLAELAAVGAAYRERFGVVVLGVALGTVTHTLNVLAFYALSRALFPAVPNLAEHLLIVPLVLFSTAIPLPFGALGATEQVSRALFRLASYDGGAVAMLAFRMLQLGGALMGLTVYLANLSQVRSLREGAEQIEDDLGREVVQDDPAGAGVGRE